MQLQDLPPLELVLAAELAIQEPLAGLHLLLELEPLLQAHSDLRENFQA